LYTSCNNYKSAGNYNAAETNKIFHCGLHVGQTVQCKSFPGRESGYDLICGNELVDGQVTTSGRNELLLVEREERRERLSHEPIFFFCIPVAAFLLSLGSLLVALISLKLARASSAKQDRRAETSRAER